MKFGLKIHSGLFAVASGQSVFLPEESIYVGSNASWHSAVGSSLNMEGCFVSGEYIFDFNSANSKVSGQFDTLMDFFNHTGGDTWIRSDRWGYGDPCLDIWFGVSCDCEGYVTGLTLPNNGILGSIPESISSLSRINMIDLHSRTAAQQVYDVSSGVNRISGTVPSLSNLTLLSILDLSGNRITGFDSDLSSNRKLQLLSLSGNRLSKFPIGLEFLTDLRVLELQNNLINDTVPTLAICNMSKVYIIDLGNNTLNGDFYDSCLDSLNPQVFDLSGLHPWPSTSSGGLTGTIPESLVESWTNIEQGYLSFYVQFGIEGHFSSTCVGVRFCRPNNFRSHEDLAWIQSGSEVPESVFQAIDLATR